MAILHQINRNLRAKIIHFWATIGNMRQQISCFLRQENNLSIQLCQLQLISYTSKKVKQINQKLTKKTPKKQDCQLVSSFLVSQLSGYARQLHLEDDQVDKRRISKLCCIQLFSFRRLASSQEKSLTETNWGTKFDINVLLLCFVHLALKIVNERKALIKMIRQNFCICFASFNYLARTFFKKRSKLQYLLGLTLNVAEGQVFGHSYCCQSSC